MDEADPRFWDVFFEVFEHLPRQGPGTRASAARALGLCRELPPVPAILDLGCGVGGQTLHLAELTAGTIVALDRHEPFITSLRRTLAARGLASRVRPLVADMAATGLPPATFDLIWSEGALYQIGIANALEHCRALLRPGGFLVFTDAVWRRENPPPPVKASFDLDYPDMMWTADILALLTAAGFTLTGHFTLPDEDWWEDFYTPMLQRIAELRCRYANDTTALAILDQLAGEPEMHRRYADFYAYEFFIARRPG